MLEKPSDAEEQYFRRQELERRAALRAKLEAAAAEAEQRRGIASAVGTADLELAQRIRELGFDAEAAAVFDLLPLIAVAWADGSVTRDERVTILRVLEARGLGPHHPGFELVETLLEQRPTQAYLDEAFDVLRRLVAEREADPAALLDLCVAVAEASGGFLGLGNRISEAERATLAKIAERLGATSARVLAR